MRDKDGKPIVALPEKHIDIVHLDFSKDERDIYDALFKNAKSKFLGYAKEGTVLQNVTAIFSILMRLRQAVLHPSLVLKRLKENLRIKQAATNTGAPEEDMGEIEDVAIQRLIERYVAGSADAGSEKAASQVIDEMLEVSGSKGAEVDVGECMLCMEVRFSDLSEGKRPKQILMHLSCSRSRCRFGCRGASTSAARAACFST